MALTLTAKEHQMLTAVVQEMNEIPGVDFNKIAAITGQKYPKNARSAFKKLWDKLKAGNASAGVQAAGSGGEDAEVEALKSKGKTAPKKRVGQRKAPTKAVGPGRRTKRKPKKEREADIKAKAAAKAKAEAEDDANEEGDTTGITATEGDVDDESGSENDVHVSQASSPGIYRENQENDEISAALLGISVEEFRSTAEESYVNNGYAPPTPRAYLDSGDEV